MVVNRNRLRASGLISWLAFLKLAFAAVRRWDRCVQKSSNFQQLETTGFDVVEAESDEEAWERYQAGGVDRIVVAEAFLKSH